MTWEIGIEHIAGILSGRARIEPGLNAVRASNWQGKSSFVEAIKTGLGVSTTLTEGKDRGGVTIRRPEGTVDVRLQRKDGTVRRQGEPVLTDDYDSIRTELFACLDETNAIRRAVREGKNLAELLLEPLDFQNIDQRIADLKREREAVESELASAREAKKRLPKITEKVTRLESELDDLRERQRALAADDAAVDGTRSDLAEAQSERDRATSRIERLERSVERTEDKLAERREQLEGIDVSDPGAIESELATERDRLETLQRDLEVLQSVYSATEMVLSEDRLGLLTDVQRELTGDELACWTCGSTVDRAAVESQLDGLGDRIAGLRGRVDTRHERVEQLEARREEVTRSRRRKRELETEIGELEGTLADQRERLEAARQCRRGAQRRIDELSDSVEQTVEEITDVESDIKYREAELSDARDELESLQTRADRVETLTERRESLQSEIESLRSRKDEIKRETRAAFDEAIGEIVSRFKTGFEAARLTPEFDLVVARDGREASLDALSEGELELLGFVAALAGYESFDVAETVPVLLVDGVGGLDDQNLHTLVEYLRDRTDYLVFTVYPEYGSFDGREIDPTEWTVAADVEAHPQ